MNTNHSAQAAGRRRRHAAHGARVVALVTSVAATGGVGAAMMAADRAAAPDLELLETSSAPVSAAATATSSASATTVATTGPTTTTAGKAATSTTTAATTAATGYADGTWIGTAQYTKWGNVQVKVVVSGGRIVDIVTVQIPSDSKSASINARATPTLEAQAIARQSATLDIVSGATYTSRTYAASLQAALDLAKSGVQP